MNQAKFLVGSKLRLIIYPKFNISRLITFGKHDVRLKTSTANINSSYFQYIRNIFINLHVYTCIFIMYVIEYFVIILPHYRHNFLIPHVFNNRISVEILSST